MEKFFKRIFVGDEEGNVEEKSLSKDERISKEKGSKRHGKVFTGEEGRNRVFIADEEGEVEKVEYRDDEVN